MNQLDVLPPETRTLLIETWNGTGASYSSDLCIHQLFEQQVNARPMPSRWSSKTTRSPMRNSMHVPTGLRII